MTMPPRGSVPVGAPPRGGQPPHPFHPPPRGTDGLAVAALVTGVLGLALVPLGLGIASLVRISRKGTGGKGMAIASIALGAISLVFWTYIAIQLAVAIHALGEDLASFGDIDWGRIVDEMGNIG